MLTQTFSKRTAIPVLFILLATSILLILTACSDSLEQSGTEQSAPVVDEPVEPVATTVAEDSLEVESAPSATNTASVAEDETETETETEDEDEDEDEEMSRPDGWSDETHSKRADPNYDVVFPEDAVNSMTITISPDDWQAMIDNMTELYGEPTGDRGGGFGQEAGGGPPVDGERQRPGEVPLVDGEGQPAGGRIRGERPVDGGERPGGGGGGGGREDFATENPDYVTAEIEFEGDVWTNVGVRFKGNSTLRNAWNSGSLELPFKFDFDEFEDDYPEIDDQRFYGFKQLSLQSPSADQSYIRAPLAYAVMEDMGLVAPQTAWYDLFVDYGEGAVSFGLYTVIEVVDDTVIETVFGDDDGNIYEGDGTGVSLAEGTFDLIADSFQKENNDENDYSDLEALYTVLHADTRLTDSDQWRTDLEALFDVDTFLQWLAFNTAVVNWDTYGQMTHNFYLYHEPDTDLLTWIGWDYNESFQDGRRNGTTSLSQDEVTDAWPLIRYLLDEPTYYEQYVAHLTQFKADTFDAEMITTQLQTWETMLTPYISDSAAFSSQIATVTSFVAERNNAVETFLSTTNN